MPQSSVPLCVWATMCWLNVNVSLIRSDSFRKFAICSNSDSLRYGPVNSLLYACQSWSFLASHLVSSSVSHLCLAAVLACYCFLTEILPSSSSLLSCCLFSQSSEWDMAWFLPFLPSLSRTALHMPLLHPPRLSLRHAVLQRSILISLGLAFKKAEPPIVLGDTCQILLHDSSVKKKYSV